MNTIDRRKFLQRALTATVLAVGTKTVLGKLIPELSGDDEIMSGTYKIDISQSAYYVLQSVGGSLLLNVPNDDTDGTIIVTRATTSQFYAISDICTHAGCSLPAYSASLKCIECVCHGSEYSAAGVVLRGPATRNLTSYGTTFDGVKIVAITLPGLMTGIAGTANSLPAASLAQNFPNPVSSAGTIQYTLSAQTKVVLALYSVDGKEVMRLTDAQRAAGVYNVPFDATTLPTGEYFYTLRTSNGWSQTKQLVVRR